jgi:hypothetical protein
VPCNEILAPNKRNKDNIESMMLRHDEIDLWRIEDSNGRYVLDLLGRHPRLMSHWEVEPDRDTGAKLGEFITFIHESREQYCASIQGDDGIQAFYISTVGAINSWISFFYKKGIYVYANQNLIPSFRLFKLSTDKSGEPLALYLPSEYNRMHLLFSDQESAQMKLDVDENSWAECFAYAFLFNRDKYNINISQFSHITKEPSTHLVASMRGRPVFLEEFLRFCEVAAQAGSQRDPEDLIADAPNLLREILRP